MKRRSPTDDELALWRAALRDVTPLPGRPAVPPPPAAPPPPPVDMVPVRPPMRTGYGLDRRTAERLRRGEMPIEARLDLHGMTQDEAYRALSKFVLRSQAAGFRCVIVITGKGAVLRDAVPRWLEEGETRGRVLASAEAQPRHGGGGARYLLLRRLR